MNAALRWILYGSLGAAGGLTAFFVAARWFPYVTIRDLLGPIPKSDADPKTAVNYLMRLIEMPPLTTLGTTYGHVAYFLLGATLGAAIVGALRWERHGALVGLGWAFLAFFLTGPVSRGCDALADVLTIATGGMIPDLVWCGLVAMGIALTIGFLQGPTGPRMKRAVVAGLVAAIVAYGVRSAMAPLASLSTIGDFGMFGSARDPRELEALNLWESSRWSMLLQQVAMGISLGLSFAYVESRMRRGTLRLVLGKNEGEAWELPAGPVMLGSAEGLEIRLPTRLGVAPRHASIVPHTEHGLAFSPEPGQTVAHNGRPTQGEWLRHGDRLGLGKATLVYEEPNTAKAYAAPALSHWIEHPDGRRIGLAEGVSVLGSDPASAVPLPYPAIAPRHAEIRVAGGRAVLADLGSGFGTTVAGAPVVSVRELKDGETIGIGMVQLVYRSRRL